MSFHKSKVNDLPIFAIGVRDGIYLNPDPFDAPPITELNFQKLIDTYTNKRGAYENGGSAQKGPYQAARQALLDGLDQMAVYVDLVAKGDENIILLGGYVPSKGNRSETPSPVQPTGVSVKRGEASGILIAECENQSVAISYGCIVTVNQPLPANVVLNANGQLIFSDTEPSPPAGTMALSTALISGLIDFNPGRKKKFKNLIPGLTYYFVFYAANATGVSPFSESKSIMCA